MRGETAVAPTTSKSGAKSGRPIEPSEATPNLDCAAPKEGGATRTRQSVQSVPAARTRDSWAARPLPRDAHRAPSCLLFVLQHNQSVNCKKKMIHELNL